jgi:hypothetical protein
MSSMETNGFSAHRQAPVASFEICIHLATERLNLQPLLLSVRLGHAGRFIDALYGR